MARQLEQHFRLLVLQAVDDHRIDLFVDDDVAEPARCYERHALVAVPRLDGFAHRLAESVAPFRRRLIRRIVGVHHHRHHRQPASGQDTPIEKAERVADPDLFAQLVAARDIELGIDQGANQMIRQLLRRLIFGRRFRPALTLGVFPSRRPVLVVLDDGQRFAVIDREHRHVLVVKLLLLIVAENNRYIGVCLLQRIAQVFYRFQASFIAFAKLLGCELRRQPRLCLLEQGRIVQPRIGLVLFQQVIPILGAYAQLRTVRRADTDYDLCHNVSLASLSYLNDREPMF